jgi:2-dehydro-3-deoxyglucarate aldolase
MEHSTISIEQGQRIISSCHGENVPCIPRPVSHSNDHIKPLLESGADGMLIQMVETPDHVESLLGYTKYPPVGRRTYGVNRAQAYGLDFDSYINSWNQSSIVLLQIESLLGVQNIDHLLAYDEVDGVMIGPLDLAGSLGVPGQTKHPLVLEASHKVIDACQRHGKSCGTQVSEATPREVDFLFSHGYTYAILGSDLFVLTKWASDMQSLINTFKR